LNGRVLLFNLALCVFLACLCSLAPLLFARGTDLQAALRSSQGSGRRGSSRLFSILIACESAFAFLLLAGSGLMLHSLIRVQQTDRGFRPEHVLTLRVPVGGTTKYATKPQQMAYYHDILERLQRVPGVAAAAFVNNLPLSGANTTLTNQQGSEMVAARTISAQYFTAMGIPLLEGRAFADSDRGVAIVNQYMARQLFPDRDPVGQTMRGGLTIVGVVKDSSQASYDQPVKNEMYEPYRQYIFGTFLSTFVIRTAGDPLALADVLRQEVWAVDPDQPVLKVETMDDVIADSIWRPRFSAWIFSVIGGLALVLTCAGVYSVVAYTATLRAREVGIRVALGATPSRIIVLILRDAMLPLTAGLAVSLIAALLLSRLLTGLLYEIGPGDPVAYIGAGAVLVIAGVFASVRPALRAASADPAQVLRSE
jgi:putative ABC transport system permease protein